MKNNFKDKLTPSSNDYSKMPDDSFDLVNKYGRCNVQATADTDNPFPHIAQGLPNKRYRFKMKQEKDFFKEDF